MKKLHILGAIAATGMVAAVPTTASAAVGAVNADDGVKACVIGGTPPNCVYGLETVSSGPCNIKFY